MKPFAALALALLLGGSATAQVAPWDEPTLTTAPAPIYGPKGDDQRGALTYAGGLYLTSSSSRLGGLSGLEAENLPDGGVLFSAVTDSGDFVQMTGQLDDAGRLIGASDLKIVALRDDRGEPFTRKADGDAEDISLLTDRPGFLVSFEGAHRIVAYEDPRRPDGAQVRIDIPAGARELRPNSGIEAVAALPGGVVASGVEDGRIWLCPPAQAACTQITDKIGGLNPSEGLTGLDHLSNGEMVAVYRSKALFAHWNARIVHIRMVEGKARITVLGDFHDHFGNMEGISAVPLPDGAGWRLYLISDNGLDPREPNLLLAFDWKL